MPRDSRPLKIFLTAGESSGDALGAALMKALRAQTGDSVSFYGIGGPQMEEQGLQTIFPMRDLSVMGLLEVIPKLGKILKRIRQTIHKIEKINPDIVVTIDSPDFSFRVVKSLKRRNKVRPKLIHYVAPTVWAWRAERAEKVAALYDVLLCLYPMEPSYFANLPIDAHFTGHPLSELNKSEEAGRALRAEYAVPENAPVLGLFPGSRMGEINRTGPVLREAAIKIASKQKETHFVVPTLPHLEREVRYLLEEMPCPVHIISAQKHKLAAFSTLDFALATSGTVGLELAMAGVPHIIAYKMNPLTWRLIKNRLSVKYAHLINILLDREIVPEFIQEKCRPDLIAEGVDPDYRYGNQCHAFEEARAMLRPENNASSAMCAAKAVLSAVQSRSAIGT